MSVHPADLPESITYQSYWSIFHKFDFHFEELHGFEKPCTNEKTKNKHKTTNKYVRNRMSTKYLRKLLEYHAYIIGLVSHQVEKQP